MKKIFLVQIPLPLQQALAEHLDAARGFALHVFEKIPPGLDPDLIVTGAGGLSASPPPACPIFPLSTERPVKLGAVLRQIGQMLAQPVLYLGDIRIGDCLFKPQEKSLIRKGGEEAALTDREVDILAYLLRHRAAPVSREALLKDVWQYQEGVDTHTLETHIYRLRQKMEDEAEAPRLLLTVDGGYCLHLPETAV